MTSITASGFPGTPLIRSAAAAAAERSHPAGRNDRGPAGGTGAPRAAAHLSEAEQALVRELQARDREVRAHERAHAAAAGSVAQGGPQYTFARGPDGRLYATGGEVRIDTSPVPGDPEATLAKAEQIRRAALAPAEPSAQDRAVAAQAAAMAAQALAEMRADDADDTPVPGVAAADRPGSGACPACGGHHGPGEHAGAVGERLQRTYGRADADREPAARPLLASA